MIELLFISSALVSNAITDENGRTEGMHFAHESCTYEVEPIDFLSADEMWLLDYIDMLQSHNGPLLRFFDFADYRKQNDTEKDLHALLVFSRKVHVEDVKVFRLASTGGAKQSSTFVAKKGSGFDFGINMDFTECGDFESEQTVFFNISDPTKDVVYFPAKNDLE